MLVARPYDYQSYVQAKRSLCVRFSPAFLRFCTRRRSLSKCNAATYFATSEDIRARDDVPGSPLLGFAAPDANMVRRCAMRAIAAASTPCVRSGCVRSMRATRSDFLPRFIDSRLFRKAGKHILCQHAEQSSGTCTFGHASPRLYIKIYKKKLLSSSAPVSRVL